MVEKSSLDTPRTTESSPEKTWINGRSTSLHIWLQGYGVTTDGWRDAGKTVQLTLEVLGCASHAKQYSSPENCILHMWAKEIFVSL